MIKFIFKNKLLATTAICAVMLCAKSYALEPTLDTLKAQSTTLSGNYVLTELGENTLPEGATKVKIGNTVYYFTPSGDNADLLKALAGTSAGNLIEDANGVFDLGGTKYGFNVSAIPNSIFSYETGDETNYHFITHEANDEGVLTTTYHTISIKPGEFSTSPNITWTSVDESKKDEANVIAVNLPNDDVKYFQYTWTEVDTTRDKYTEHQTSLSGDVTADFIGIKYETTSTADGGAIYNEATISSITGDFIGNSASGKSANGGVILNSSTIETITGDFINNSATSTSSSANGGAIYNAGYYKNGTYIGGTISSITGDFINNSATSTSSSANGGAIYNGSDNTIKAITGDFVGNSATSTNSSATGGAIYNSHTITSITGDFTGNSATSTYKTTQGGAIFNYGTIESITGDFINNSATSTSSSAQGGAIHNHWYTIIESIIGDFIGNSATGTYAKGGAIFNYGTIESITGDFINNSATSTSSSASGGAIYNNGRTIESITGDFINNSATSTSSSAYGGAIYNYSRGTITSVADASNSADSLQDDILFQGNYVEDKDGKRYEAIYNEGVINITSNNGGSYTLYDYIDGNNGTLNFVSDDHKGATINLYNNIQNQKDINFQNKYILNMISPDDIHSDTSKYSYIQAQSININAALQMMLDVDLENAEMDRFEAENFTIADTGSIDVTKFNIVTDVTGDIGTTTEVDFIVSDNATGLDKITNVTEAVGEVYTYTVTFNPDTGAFEFVSTGLAPKPVTPAPEKVAPNQAPALTTNTTVTTVETVVAQIFDRDVTISTDINYGADTPYSSERISEEATSDGVNVTNDKSVWVKTFGSDDDVEVDNFTGTIDSEAYGVVGGVDSKVFTYDNGVKAAYGVYGAYVGGKQKYDNNKVEQKSGYLGVSASFRKNNLFSNFTLNGGYVTSESNTEWGKDEFDTKVVSVANKTGYDIKAGNNWTITPAMYIAYTGMDNEDYTNKAGVKMENEFANVITLAPEVKVRKGFNNGVGAYSKVSYKHYIYDSEVKADDVVLEEMSAKPYVEYGFGVEKNWADKSGYAELTRRDGGRTGWNVNLGLRLNF